MSEQGNGVLARLQRLERDISEERSFRRADRERLDSQKADVKDVEQLVNQLAKTEQRMTDEFRSLRQTLQWFIGITATGAIAFAIVIVQLIQP
jgi:hypothetical protein